MSIKTRTFKNKNYHSIFFDDKTIRRALDPKKPISELDYPEFYDVKITDKCNGGCSYCYQDSTMGAPESRETLAGFIRMFADLTPNQLPFQIAFGGGEPTMHPYFTEFLTTCKLFGIVPNYTTNGTSLTKDVLDATVKYCGGVAISTHKHLEKHWRRAIKQLTERGVKTNLHIIISDKASVDEFFKIYEEFEKDIDYFVLLPYKAVGRAKEKDTSFDYLFNRLGDTNKIAFGANFYPYLKGSELAKTLDISLYEPEILSKYIDLTNMTIYKSSFDLTKVVLPFHTKSNKLIQIK